MRKVLWPSRNELVTYSVVVIVFVVIMVAIVAGLDIGFAKLVLAAVRLSAARRSAGSSRQRASPFRAREKRLCPHTTTP